MRKPIHILLVLSFILLACVASTNVDPEVENDIENSDFNEAMILCRQFLPDGFENEVGYICLEQYPEKYLECNGITSAFIRNCAAGTICSNPAGEWDDDNPCEKRYSSESFESDFYGSDSIVSESESESESKVSSSSCGSSNPESSSGNLESSASSESSNPESSSTSSSESNTVSSSSSQNLKELCMLYMPDDSMISGFVCLEKDSTQYLECAGTEIANIRNCAEGLVCATPIGVWNNENPCDWAESSENNPSSSASSPSSSSSTFSSSAPPSSSSSSSSSPPPASSSSSSSNSLEELCTMYSGESDNAGFVCLQENAAEYLRCYNDHDISMMLPCPMGTRCTAEVGTWTEDPPCSAGYDGNLPNTSDELCMQYVGSIYDFGYVCLEANATSYLRCFLAHGVSVVMDCAPGTKCTATPGTLTTAAPCT